MKQLLTITEMFNDAFTNYEDKISSITMEVDIEKDCKCTPIKKCIVCKLVERGELTEINEYPKAMEVSDYEDFSKSFFMYVIAYIKDRESPYITAQLDWKYARDINTKTYTV